MILEVGELVLYLSIDGIGFTNDCSRGIAKNTVLDLSEETIAGGKIGELLISDRTDFAENEGILVAGRINSAVECVLIAPLVSFGLIDSIYEISGCIEVESFDHTGGCVFSYNLANGNSLGGDCGIDFDRISNSGSSGKPIVKWTAVSGATKYDVYRATSESGTYTLIKTATTNSYTDTSATVGKTYYYKVKAYSTTGTTYASAYSAAVSAKAKK